MTTVQNISLAVIASVFFAFAALLLTTSPAHAASSDAQFMQLKSQLELLRADITKMRTSSSTRASSTRPVVDRTCMQEALNTREGSILSAFESFNTTIIDAMKKRQTAFSSVWTNTEISNSGKYKGIWSEWKKSAEAARKKLRSDREAAWKTFRETAVTSCKAKLPKEEAATQDALI
jgi:hypothetical protein